LRKGNVASGHGAARIVADAMATARAAGATGPVLVRADSAYYRQDLIAATIRAGAWFSVTARMTRTVRRAIAAIDEQAWTPIRYPRALLDADTGRWVSEAFVAEVDFTAFTGHPQKRQVPCRLIVRRIPELNQAAEHGQDELFQPWRYHAFISNSTLGAVHADELHRDHAIIEQTIAELKDGPLAHAPSGKFTANAAWLALAVTAFNLSTRCRRRRLDPARPSPLGHPAPTPHRRPRPDRHPRPTADPALAHTLALADRLARPVDRGHLSLTGTTDRPQGTTCSGKAGQTGRQRAATRTAPQDRPRNHASKPSSINIGGSRLSSTCAGRCWRHRQPPQRVRREPACTSRRAGQRTP
jgi:hypothetical protein